MSTKQHPGSRDIYAELGPDEPYFIVRARDAHAPMLVRLWAVMRETAVQEGMKPPGDMDAVDEAKHCAYEMERWRRTNEVGRVADE